MSIGGDNLDDLYRKEFDIVENLKITLTEYRNLTPFDIDIKIGMYRYQREKEVLAIKARNEKNKAKSMLS